MADVLNLHADWWWDGRVHCDGCDWFQDCSNDVREAAETFRAHLAAALSAAGFGPVRDEKRRLELAALLAYDAVEDSALREARAEAWDEGKNDVWTFMTNTDPRRERPTNPYRESSNDHQ